jgi:hypothetical protein
MFKLADRVKETTLTQGTGTLTLQGSFGSFQTFSSGIGSGNTTFYTIENNSQFEIGIGTFNSNTLSRDTVLSSSNNNNKINLAGVSLVFCTYPASKSVFLENGFIKSLSPQYSGIIFPDQTVLTSASGVAGNISLPSGLVYTSGATFTGLISSPSGNFTSLTVSGIPLLNGGYDNEIHVSQVDGNDTTGNGDLLNPVASITKALTLVSAQRRKIIVHSGGYTENPSITSAYTTLTSEQQKGDDVIIYGTLSTSVGCTIAGLKMTNLNITTPASTGSVNILGCDITGTLTKSSTSDYTLIRFCDIGTTNITGGGGLVAIFGGNPNLITINNAGARVIAKNVVTVSPVLTAGNANFVDSIVIATGSTNNAITTSAGTIVTLANSQFIVPAFNSVARVALSGFYSIFNCVYDKPNSTLVALSATGGSTNSIDYFQYINADKFITQGGTSSQYLKGDGSLALFPDNIVYTSGNQTISGVKTFSDLPFVNGTGVSISGHSHTSSNITDFNSSVSGLLPVKNITAGYDISITNTSGTYSIASTNLVHVDSKQPQGFVNRTDSRISVSGNIFTIEPTGSSYSYYNQGIKVVKTSGDSLTIPNITQINYIHFDTVNNQISNKTTSFDFSGDIPIAYIAWNSGVGPSGQMTFFAEERHGIVMDTSTHKWIHNTFGMQYVDGLSIGNYVLGGNGSSNTHATISIGNGTLYQEDIQINITDSSSTDPFCQELSPIAQIPVYYHDGTTGQWVKNTATDYPVKYGANGPQYNLLTGSTWTTPYVSPGGQTRYFAAWILATNQIDDPIISIMGQRYDGSEGAAENNNSWADVNLTNLPLSEVKPLYRLIFAADSNSYTNVPKCRLMSILDIRVAVISTIAGVAQNDHGSLFGLGDDDHSQYVHIDNARTINATHVFQNGITFDGSGTQNVAYIPDAVNITGGSGDFSSLKLNSTTVSVSGHTHTSSNITDFSSSVSGLVNGIYAPLAGATFTGLLTGISGNFIQSLQVNNIDVSLIRSYTVVSNFPASGISNTYYLASDTSRMYQWTGSYYAEIGPPISSINNAQNAANLYLWNNFK